MAHGGGLRRPDRRYIGAEAGGLGQRAGQHDAVEVLAVDLPARALRRGGQLPNAVAAEAMRAMGLQPAPGRIGQQGRQGHPRQQQVRAARPAEQGVLQHAQEDLSAGLLHRCIQCRQAQRLDQLALHRLGQGAA